MCDIKPDHRYSYSQLTSFEECPYAFYLQRIEETEQVSNGFAEQGTLIHDLIDRWARGELPKEKLVEEYELRYPLEVVTAFPPMLASKGYTEKTYNQGLDYFQHFDGFKDYEILGTEMKFETTIADRRFSGIVDMVARLRETGQLVILDHKSKSLSSFRKSEKEMYRQQYLYSKYVFEKYGEWPELLSFNLFKEHGKIMTQPFVRETYEETLAWAAEIIHQIESCTILDWLQSKEKSDFFCQELCSVRNECTNGARR